MLRSRPGLHRRVDRRPGDARRRRAVSDVHQPRGVSPLAAAGQRRPPADAAWPRRSGLVDALRWQRFERKAGRNRPRAWHCSKATRTADGSLLKLLRRPETSLGAPCRAAARVGRRSDRSRSAGRVRREVRRLRRPAGTGDRAAIAGWPSTRIPASFRLCPDHAASRRGTRKAQSRPAHQRGPGQPDQRHYAGRSWPC